MTGEKKKPKPKSTNNIMTYQNRRNEQKKTIQTFRDKNKTQEIRMAYHAIKRQRKMEQHFQYSEGKLIPVNILYSSKTSLKCEGRKMTS